MRFGYLYLKVVVSNNEGTDGPAQMCSLSYSHTQSTDTDEDLSLSTVNFV